MSTQDNLTNAFIRHQVFVQRFGAKVGNDFISTMIDLQEAAQDRLLASDLTDFQRERLELIARDLEAQFRASVSESAQERISELKQFGEYEAEFSQGLLETNISGSTTLPSPEQIGAAIDFANMKVGNTGLGIQQIFRGFTDNAAKQVAREITEGAVLGETNKQISDRLQRLNGLHKNQATTLTRTVTNNVSSIARDEVMRANEDVLDGYEWVAALDNRTTLVCASRDGQVYKFSDPEAPRPPAHFNCRSTIVPKVKPEFDLGADVKTTRPAIGDDGAELIDSDTTYEKWLRKQPAKFQDEVLGKDRGKLFRNKGIKLDRFVDANGNPIPLDQLKVLDESFNIKAKTKKIAETLPPVEPMKPNNVLPSMFSSTDKVTKEKINAVYENIATPEMAKLQQFMQEKQIKTVLVKQTEMSTTAKASRSIVNDVAEYLYDPSEEEYKNLSVIPRSAIYLYAHRKPKMCNGFTSSFYRHVVVKNKTGAKFTDPKTIASRLKDVVKKYLDIDGITGKWSFSDGMGEIYKDDAAAMASTLLHEIGHQVHYYAGFPDLPESLKSARPTRYGTYNQAEEHAELFVAWVVDRDSLFRRSPETAIYFDELMEKAMKSRSRTGRSVI